MARYDPAWHYVASGALALALALLAPLVFPTRGLMGLLLKTLAAAAVVLVGVGAWKMWRSRSHFGR